MAKIFRVLLQLDLTEGNFTEKHRKWQREMKVYMPVIASSSKLKEQQTAVILHCNTANH